MVYRKTLPLAALLATLLALAHQTSASPAYHAEEVVHYYYHAPDIQHNVPKRCADPQPPLPPPPAPPAPKGSCCLCSLLWNLLALAGLATLLQNGLAHAGIPRCKLGCAGKIACCVAKKVAKVGLCVGAVWAFFSLMFPFFALVLPYLAFSFLVCPLCCVVPMLLCYRASRCAAGYSSPWPVFMSCGRGSTCSNSDVRSSSTHLPASPLCPGSRGRGVAQLQEQLIALGRMSEDQVRYCRGYYGPYTKSAVQQVQRELGDEPTGVYTPSVRAVLESQLTAQVAKSAATNDGAKSSVEEPARDPTTIAPSITTASVAHPGSALKLSMSEETLALQREYDEQAASRRAATVAELVALGFDEAAASHRVSASGGDFKEAVRQLLHDERSRAATPVVFDAAWEPLVSDLKEMGFSEEVAREALVGSNGVLKEAVRELVANERLVKP